MRFFFALVVAVAVLLRAGAAEACSCQDPGPPCATMFLSTVFVGTATGSVDKNGSGTTTFAVTEVLHSEKALGKIVEVHHGTIGSMCGLTFTKGKAYVIYAGGTGALSTGACTRTHVFRKGDEDVAYAHAEVKRAEAVVEGHVVLMEGGDGKAQAAVQVRASGTSVTATSDAKGAFKLLVPPGSYALEVVTPGLRNWQGKPPEVSLPVAAACASPTVTVSWDGRIAGTLTGADGKPVVGLEVFALAKREKDRHWRVSARTDAEGRYLIHEVPAGQLYVGVSVPDFSGVDPSSPYPTTYYPGTADQKTAKPVSLERAGLTSGIDFVLPAPHPVFTVRGTVKRKNGALVPLAQISLVPEGRNRSTGLSADANGAFSVQELGGEVVTVRACFGIDQKLECAEDKRKLEGDVAVELVLPK